MSTFSSYPGERYADAFEGRELEAPVEMLSCCAGAAYRGLASCTCWEPEYDLEQEEPRPPHFARVDTRDAQCHDCAYLPGSAERKTDEGVEHLAEIAWRGERFWCHQGMRRVVRWRHPSGHAVEGDPVDYAPPCVDGVAYRADGQPALLCRGWARAAQAARDEAGGDS